MIVACIADLQDRPSMIEQTAMNDGQINRAGGLLVLW